MENIAIIGGGNMGSAFAEGLVSKGVIESNNLAVIEKDPKKSAALQEKIGCRIFSSIAEIDQRFAVFLLAIKPQNAKSTMLDLKPHLDEKNLTISVMAGITLATMQDILGSKNVVRVMPNTPAAIGMGMSVFYGDAKISPNFFLITESILQVVGKCLKVNSEKMIDAATAISGSGPAYLFYLAEAMTEGAKKMGFSDNEARLLSSQTLLGSASLFSETRQSAQELRSAVTSPGGTTAAAIHVLDNRLVQATFMDAFQAAFERAVELGKKEE